MKIEDIKRLISIMDEHNLAEISYEEGGQKIHLRRPDVGKPTTALLDETAPVSNDKAAGASAKAEPKSREPAAELVEIKSPLVGTFYSSSKPNSPSFVEVGAPVQPDTTLCLLEAMKVMNEIKAETEGVVQEIRVKSGQSVQFGQVLFVIKRKI